VHHKGFKRGSKAPQPQKYASTSKKVSKEHQKCLKGASALPSKYKNAKKNIYDKTKHGDTNNHVV
jgi:hypothetical protein